jgi:chloride channel protein, CIC family
MKPDGDSPNEYSQIKYNYFCSAMKILPESIWRIKSWRLRHLNDRELILILSPVVGIFSGFSAIILKNIIHALNVLLTENFNPHFYNYQYLIYPFIGILITFLYVKYFVKSDISHGITKVLDAISNRKSIIRPHNMITSMISSTITIGFGGSVGAEAPIVLTGSSIGSNIARYFRLNYRMMTLLVGCGAAGAISGIFKAPFAGMLFAIEVLMLDLTMSSLLPLLISSASAATLAYFFMGSGYQFTFRFEQPFQIHNIHWYVLLGVFCGLFSFIFTRGNIYIEKLFRKIKYSFVRIIIGGSILGLLIFFFPSLWGEGYHSIDMILNNLGVNILNNSFLTEFKGDSIIFPFIILMIMLMKIVAMSATIGSGGNGGVFAPTLFIGGLAGFFITIVLNQNGFHVSTQNFVLAGMAGMMAGVMHAPMTAIFLIAEITGGFGLFIPLMITSAVAYLVVMPLEPHSIYHKTLALRGELITHDKDKAVLTLVKLGNVVETDLLTIDIQSTLGELVKIISKSKRNVFPVVDKDNNFHGVILLDDIRGIIFNEELYDNTYVKDLLTAPPTIISPNDRMETVMKKFDDTEAWNLPVVRDMKYVGYVSKSTIFNAYRSQLVHFSEN